MNFTLIYKKYIETFFLKVSIYMNLQFKEKYLKYKKKYLNLKDLMGGVHTDKTKEELIRNIFTPQGILNPELFLRIANEEWEKDGSWTSAKIIRERYYSYSIKYDDYIKKMYRKIKYIDSEIDDENKKIIKTGKRLKELELRKEK